MYAYDEEFDEVDIRASSAFGRFMNQQRRWAGSKYRLDRHHNWDDDDDDYSDYENYDEDYDDYNEEEFDSYGTA